MTMAKHYLHLDKLAAPVRLQVEPAFIKALPPIFSHWDFQVTDTTDTPPFLTIKRTKRGYLLTSPYLEEPETHIDAVNAICAMIAEIAWARLRQETDLLCLHGAAIEIAGRLVVFPSNRRAGKSTLSVGLAAAGRKIFTDDFLPLHVDTDGLVTGISSGISPRLRHPFPRQAKEITRDYVEKRASVSNKQYHYVVPNQNELANFGDSAPLGALVYLEHSINQTASLEEISLDEALQALIRQNFSRAMNAGTILEVLDSIVEHVPVFRLKYDELGPAVSLLVETFQEWSEPAPRLTGFDPEKFTSVLDSNFKPEVLDPTCGQFIQPKGIVVIEAEGKRFLSGQKGKTIHHLNDGAAMIWKLLEEPTSLEEAIEILSSAFPDQPEGRIREDVETTFANFAENGLLSSASA